MFPSDDLMHLDLHTKNVLQDTAGGLAAIIDWESACAGDSRFDLAYFAFTADVAHAGVAQDLWAAVERSTPPEVLEAYVAHLVLRMVDWSLRHHGRHDVERWLDAGQELIRRSS
jgi:aminoglycoside phosphotransferase (APT) family kinase protein